ncbi:MAG: hypothetical protein VB141_10530 [Burkholderia gladioli]
MSNATTACIMKSAAIITMTLIRRSTSIERGSGDTLGSEPRMQNATTAIHPTISQANT